MRKIGFFLDVFVGLCQTISPTKYINATTIMEEVDLEEDYRSRAEELAQLRTDEMKDSRVVELPQPRTDDMKDSLEDTRVVKKSKGWRKRKGRRERDEQLRCSQIKARNKLSDILDDLTRVLNITEITRRLGDAYDGNKILVSKYDVLILASTYIQYLERVLREKGVNNNFNRRTALENIQFLTKLSRVELPSTSSA